jgi:hypothetical protein
VTEIQYENIPNLSDITSWIFECNRFLYYAKIHLDDPTFKMKFSEDPIIFVEKISTICKMSEDGSEAENTLLLLEPREKNRKIPSKHEIKIGISDKKIAELFKTINLIKLGEWNKLTPQKIEACQKILLNFFNDLKREIAKIHSTPS